MNTILYSIITAFLLSLALTLIILPLLKRLKAGQYILGYVKEHKDKSGTPTMGGLAFISAIIISTIFFCGFDNRSINLTIAITAGFLIVGFLDDFLKIYKKKNEGLKAYQKIIFQVAIAVIAAVFSYMNELSELKIPFSSIGVDILWGIIPLVIFVYAATVNCVNLTDGLDGLAAGTSLCYMLMMGLMLYFQDSPFAVICFISCGALAAFLIFNTNRASLFMGDTGSLALGGLISCMSVFSGNLLYIPILGITFVFSGISVIIQVIYYKKTRKRVFLMSPIHHHFQMKGFSESKIAFCYAVVTLFVGIICLLFVR